LADQGAKQMKHEINTFDLVFITACSLVITFTSAVLAEKALERMKESPTARMRNQKKERSQK